MRKTFLKNQCAQTKIPKFHTTNHQIRTNTYSSLTQLLEIGTVVTLWLTNIHLPKKISSPIVKKHLNTPIGLTILYILIQILSNQPNKP
jgi:hypothetical protein